VRFGNFRALGGLDGQAMDRVNELEDRCDEWSNEPSIDQAEQRRVDRGLPEPSDLCDLGCLKADANRSGGNGAGFGVFVEVVDQLG
jgi:hypothetical protein